MTQVYGEDCTCDEMQPRRGKNLPEGSLDSRAKKLVPNDKDDYEFSIWWLSENASPVYRDESRQVVGLRNVSEVSLCKAHSSTLYRAKKRHERGKNQAPPSPADSNGIDTAMMDAIPAHSSTANHGRPYSDPYPLQPQLHHHYQIPPPYPTHMRESSLAAKVRDMKCDHQPPPDFSTMTSSTSLKRKRTNNMSLDQQRPHSSASTPLYATGMAPLLSHPPPSSSSSAVSASTSRHETPDSFTPHQLPPLQSREPLSILSSSLQHSLQVTPLYSQKQDPPSPPTPVVKNNEPEIVVETVSLKTFPTPECPSTYHVRNLAISDTFTFRDLLQEVDMIGTPPPGKKIVISDEKNEMVFPLDQAIRSVFRRPSSTHMELCVSLSDKPSIDWSMYTWGRKDIGFFSLFSFFFLFSFPTCDIPSIQQTHSCFLKNPWTRIKILSGTLFLSLPETMSTNEQSRKLAAEANQKAKEYHQARTTEMARCFDDLEMDQPLPRDHTDPGNSYAIQNRASIAHIYQLME